MLLHKSPLLFSPNLSWYNNMLLHTVLVYQPHNPLLACNEWVRKQVMMQSKSMERKVVYFSHLTIAYNGNGISKIMEVYG